VYPTPNLYKTFKKSATNVFVAVDSISERVHVGSFTSKAG
jgi:hypothetical protein